jgi:hypothetical protein
MVVVLKQRADTGEPWFFYGTIALIIFNSGISLFGQAVIEFIQWKKVR